MPPPPHTLIRVNALHICGGREKHIDFSFSDWQKVLFVFRTLWRNDLDGDVFFVFVLVPMAWWWCTKGSLSGNVERTSAAALCGFPLFTIPCITSLKTIFQIRNFLSKRFYFFQYNNRNIHHG